MITTGRFTDDAHRAKAARAGGRLQGLQPRHHRGIGVRDHPGGRALRSRTLMVPGETRFGDVDAHVERDFRLLSSRECNSGIHVSFAPVPVANTAGFSITGSLPGLSFSMTSPNSNLQRNAGNRPFCGSALSSAWLLSETLGKDMNSARKLLIMSIVLLVILGLRPAANFPAIYESARASGISAFSSGRIVGAFLGACIWYFLAIAQWRNGGRWGFGIGVFAVVVFLMQSTLFLLALGSGRVAPTLSSIASYIGFTVIAVGFLAIVNFRLYAIRKAKTA